MSTTLISKAVSAAVVTAMLLLGCVFGYLTLGQNQTPADAAVTTPADTPCVFCENSTTTGEGGSVPSSIPAGTSIVGSGGTISVR